MNLPFRNNPVRTRAGTFYPEGTFSVHSVADRTKTRLNPLLDSNIITETWAGRLLVGLSVRKKARYTRFDLVRNVRSYLKKKRVPQDSSFVSQEGVYTYRDGSIVREKSAQVIIINTYTDLKSFKLLIEGLAEYLCIKLEQEMIVVEIQRNGIVDVTWLVVSEKAARAAEAQAKKEGKKIKRLTAREICG
jgi:hypothetical protein